MADLSKHVQNNYLYISHRFHSNIGQNNIKEITALKNCVFSIFSFLFKTSSYALN